MPRYSLNLRSIYGPDEPTFGESLSGGISSAIGEYQRKKEVERQEGNEIRARGGVPLPTAPAPTPGQRVRGIAGGLNDLLHGRRPDFGNVFSGPQIDGRQRDGVPSPAVPPPTTGALPYTRGDPYGQEPFDPFYRRNALGASPETAAGRMPMLPSPAGAAPAPNVAARGAQPSVASPSAVSPYVYEGIRGQRYSVDPLYGARVQAEGKEMAGRAHEEEQIRSLVDAGMDPREARARVLNNVVKYDDTFGQQPRTAGGMTFEQRKQLQDERIAASRAIALLTSSGRQNTAEYRQALLRMREIDQQLRAAEMLARGTSSEAGAIERTIPTGTNRIVEESQPGGKERIESAAERAAALRRQAADTRRQGAGRVLLRGAGRRSITQAQYDQAIAKGADDATIAQSYDIPASVKRKQALLTPKR